ncbi:MAG: SoxR reducing system RseC family protein [Bacteroidales bacterium]|nr:SoxR reducing system RseC family protein [Candidatus Cacconaster merdequi]
MSKQINRVEHDGVITDISEEYISVEIVNKSACAACHAKGVCAASDESIKVIEIPLGLDTLACDYRIGDEVKVIMKGSLGLKAIWIAYVVPLIMLVASILVFSSLHLSEVAVGLGSIAVVAVYYLGVFIFRNKLSKIFTFYIEPK